jgi:putative toxin-antitoxin system antitoxin component (TIGR02293 family)
MKQGRTSPDTGKPKKPPGHKKRRLGAAAKTAVRSGSPTKRTYNIRGSKRSGFQVDSEFDTATGLTALSNRIHDPVETSVPNPSDALEAFHGVRIILKGPFVQMATSGLKTLHRFTDEEIYNLVVPKRTLARRTAEKQPLSVEETDRAVRLARVGKMAETVFGNAEKAHRWLRKPKPSLEGETPLNYLASETGARVVEEMLTRIDHGILP